jgi:hypothetical protein
MVEPYSVVCSDIVSDSERRYAGAIEAPWPYNPLSDRQTPVKFAGVWQAEATTLKRLPPSGSVEETRQRSEAQFVCSAHRRM